MRSSLFVYIFVELLWEAARFHGVERTRLKYIHSLRGEAAVWWASELTPHDKSGMRATLSFTFAIVECWNPDLSDALQLIFAAPTWQRKQAQLNQINTWFTVIVTCSHIHNQPR